MIKGYSKHNMGRIALGTHLGDFSDTDSEKYIQAIKYAVRNGINTIDGAINYRGMRSEKDEGIALNKSLQNLGIETLDLHYIHIPEISRLGLSEEEFYTRIEALFSWYESKVSEGKIRFYGIAFEFMTEEPQEAKWHIELEKLKQLAEKVSLGENHLKYILFEYNLLCASANIDKTQTVNGEQMTMLEACHKLGFETVASMPFAMGEGLEKYSVEEMLSFALDGMEHVIVGSKDTKHIQEIIDIAQRYGIGDI